MGAGEVGTGHYEGFYIERGSSKGGVSPISCKYAAREAFAASKLTGKRYDIKGIAKCRNYEEFERAMREGAASGKRSDAFLSRQLLGLEGKRVEVVDRWGTRKRFIVGKSTGWLPIHLEILRRNSSGGAGVMGPFKSVRVIPGGRR